MRRLLILKLSPFTKNNHSKTEPKYVNTSVFLKYRYSNGKMVETFAMNFYNLMGKLRFEA